MEPTTVDFTVITDALANAVTPGEIANIIALGLGASIGLVLMWFGARKLIKVVMGAFKKGRISM